MKGVMTLVTLLLPLLVNAVVTGLSPDVRKFLMQSIDDLEKKVKATANPFDDALFSIVKSMIPPNGL